MIILKLDFHEARRTEAKTEWFIKYPNDPHTMGLEEAEMHGTIKILYNTWSPFKTHWDVYIEVKDLNPLIKFKRIRISNRGNIYERVYTLSEMEQRFKATPEEIEAILSIQGR
jgi:hypothetical protein